MYIHSLPPDDMPLPIINQRDAALRDSLEKAICKSFYQALDERTTILLNKCDWYFTTKASAPTLIIICSNSQSYSYIQKALYKIVKTLKLFCNEANISVSPPMGKGEPWHIIIREDETCLDESNTN